MLLPELGEDPHLPGVGRWEIILVLERRRGCMVSPEPGEDRRNVKAAVGVVEFEVFVNG